MPSDARPVIMVIDDTAANLQVLEQLLAGQGYRVQAFLAGELAVAAALASPPDLVLLDIAMPDLDGYEVCRRFKGSSVLRQVPIIFLSALSGAEDKVAAFAAGGVDYVTKPFHFDEVVARVRAQVQAAQHERKLEQANHRLRELETLRDGLVHMLVHDLRSPLTVMLGSLEWVQTTSQPADVKEAVGDALAAAKSLLRMVGSMLDVSRMESTRLPLKLEPIDLTSLAREELLNFEAAREGRLFEVAAERSESAWCDGSLIRRVLQNLIANAIAFTDAQSGRIVACVEGSAERVRVAIVDNGPGVPAEYRERVFDKFFQVAAWREQRAHSNGLGLTFCKLAVETHGGRVGLESATGGKGSAFWFELARVPSGLRPELPTGESTASGPRSARARS